MDEPNVRDVISLIRSKPKGTLWKLELRFRLFYSSCAAETRCQSLQVLSSRLGVCSGGNFALNICSAFIILHSGMVVLDGVKFNLPLDEYRVTDAPILSLARWVLPLVLVMPTTGIIILRK